MTPSTEFSLWRVLRGHPRRSVVVTVLMTLAGVAEGVGLLTLLPVLESATPGGGAPSRIGAAVAAILRLTGAQPSLAALFGFIAVALLAKAVFRWVAMAQVGSAVAAVAAELRLRLLDAQPSLAALFAFIAVALLAKAAFRWVAMAQVGSAVAPGRPKYAPRYFAGPLHWTDASKTTPSITPSPPTLSPRSSHRHP